MLPRLRQIADFNQKVHDANSFLKEETESKLRTNVYLWEYTPQNFSLCLLNEFVADDGTHINDKRFI